MPEPSATDHPELIATLFEVVRLKYGSLLTPEQLEAVRGRLIEQMQMGEQLAAVPLRNDDEPAFAFSAAAEA